MNNTANATKTEATALETLVNNLNASIAKAAAKAGTKAPEVWFRVRKSTATGRDFVELLWSSEDLETIRRTRTYVKAWLTFHKQAHRTMHMCHTSGGGKHVKRYQIWNVYFQGPRGEQYGWKAYQAGVNWVL